LAARRLFFGWRRRRELAAKGSIWKRKKTHKYVCCHARMTLNKLHLGMIKCPSKFCSGGQLGGGQGQLPSPSGAAHVA